MFTQLKTTDVDVSTLSITSFYRLFVFETRYKTPLPSSRSKEIKGEGKFVGKLHEMSAREAIHS